MSLRRRSALVFGSGLGLLCLASVPSALAQDKKPSDSGLKAEKRPKQRKVFRRKVTVTAAD